MSMKPSCSFVVCRDQAFLRAEFGDAIIYILVCDENEDAIDRLLLEAFSAPVPVIESGGGS
jgi:hypothetical protein